MKSITTAALTSAILLIPGIYAQTAAPTTVSVTVGPEASVSVTSSTTTLTSATAFANYTGTTSLSYKIRTTPSTGAGTITALVTRDFSPSGGPSVGSPLAGDALKYACTVASPGTACSGSVTASTSTATSVATFGPDSHSAAAGNSASVAWTLPNDPAYTAGSYNATVTFTISAT